VKHIINIVCIILIAFAFFLLMVFVEENYVLNEIIIPRADITLEEWLDSFRHWGTIGITVAATTGLLWYFLGQWMFEVNSWSKANRRPIWFLLFLGPIIAAALGVVFTTQSQGGAWAAFLFYLLNSTLCYYLATALFSPSSFKYVPVGASKLRRWNLAF
jgi:hypothetical protein